MITKLAIITIFFTATGCTSIRSGEISQDIPDFESLVSRGTLNKTGPSIEDKSTEATLSLNTNYIVFDRESCKALSLNTLEGSVLNLAVCGEDQKHVICGRSISECTEYFETSRSGNTLSLTKDKGGDDVRLFVEFHFDKLIYRVQGETCLIPYPHGCIIDGFGWRDRYIYTYLYK